MRAGILSAGTWSLGRERSPAKEMFVTARSGSKTAEWHPEQFEREQLRGLVQQLFFAGVSPAVRQVVFSAIDAEMDVRPLCRRIAEQVAAETAEDVGLVDECQRPGAALTDCSEFPEKARTRDLTLSAIPLGSNLFCLAREHSVDHSGPKPLRLYLEELRNKFKYSIVAAPSAAMSKEPFAMARVADGIVLVLSAGRTRRVAALRMKSELGGVRLLGTVLCEREFPIPWGIYRRL